MEVEISNFKLKGEIIVPGSKSITHRALIMAFISKKNVRIENVTFSEDILATINALVTMGANVSLEDEAVLFTSFNEVSGPIELDANESASTLRFLLPIAVYLFKDVRFKGKESLFRRPLDSYVELFKQFGCEVQLTNNFIHVKGCFDPKECTISGEVSSQFVTGMLFLSALKKGDFELIVNKLRSKAYVDLTIEAMEFFGYKVIVLNDVYKVFEKKTNLKNFVVEGDYSQLAFWAVLGVIKGNITAININKQSKQCDKVVTDYIRKFGGKISDIEGGYVFEESDLTGNHLIDIDNSIDLAPILFVLAAFNEGTTTFVNVDRLRIKESDRIESMKVELLKAGVDIKVLNDEVLITGKKCYQGNYSFEAHNDHRVFMALCIFATCINGTCCISGVESIKKSYPNFINELISLKK